MASFGELLDQLLVESRDVIGLATRDQTLVDVHFLVDPVPARVADVGLYGGKRCQRPPTHDTGLDERPWPVTDRADRLALLEELAHEVHGVLVGAQRVGITNPAGQHEPVVVGSVRLLNSLVDPEAPSLVVVV